MSLALDEALFREAISMAKLAKPTAAPATGLVMARTVGHDQVQTAVQRAEAVTGAETKLADTAAVERSPRAAISTDESVEVDCSRRNSRNSWKTVSFVSVASAARSVAE